MKIDNILGDGEKSWVELQDTMPQENMDLAVVNAARVSYMGESKGEEADWKLLHYLMKNSHSSPFEQAKFKFRVKAPAIVWWQWTRHRMQNLNMQSGRYTEFGREDYYCPDLDQWRLQSKNNKQGSEGTLDDDTGDGLKFLLLKQWYRGFDLYETAIQLGVAKEQARLFLPAWCAYYTAVSVWDAHNLMHFLKLRMHEHAQWEIRQYANAMFTIFEEKMPVTAEAFKEYRL